MNEIEQKISAANIRDEKIFNLTLLGWSKTRIAEELCCSRTTVSLVLNSPWGQQRLCELYSTIEQRVSLNKRHKSPIGF